MKTIKLANVRKPIKVEFIDGPLNGAIRYYTTYKIARRVAKRYCSNPIPGKFIFEYPCCEIYAINEQFKPILIEEIFN